MRGTKITVLYIFLVTFFVVGQESADPDKADFVIVFGSCNKQDKPQPYWESIIANNPDLFIWGGDNIYGDTGDMSVLKEKYEMQNNHIGYQKLKKSVPVMATWDDHDYGKNDSGAAWEKKKQSQQLFLDFLDISKDDIRRQREGIYTSRLLETPKGTIKVLILDTRYFRSPLLKDTDSKKRYKPYTDENVTLLGDTQWKWIEEELTSNKADFTVIVSSIQFLSAEHGWETWGNFPKEIKRLENMLSTNHIKNAIILSGDRHISEFSVKDVEGLDYPLIDFTSSGLTHAYSNYSGEPNTYRRGEVIFTPSFGLLKFNFETGEIMMQMRASDNTLLQQHIQQYQLK